MTGKERIVDFVAIAHHKEHWPEADVMAVAESLNADPEDDWYYVPVKFDRDQWNIAVFDEDNIQVGVL